MLQTVNLSCHFGDLKPMELTIFKQLCSQLSNSQPTIQHIKLLKQQNDMIRDVRNEIKSVACKTVITDPSEEFNASQLSIQSAYDENRKSFSRMRDLLKRKEGGPLRPVKHLSRANTYNQIKEKLDEVLKYCDNATYKCMKDLLGQYKRLLKCENDSRYYEALYNKVKKQHEQAKQKLSSYECRIAELEMSLKDYHGQPNINEQRLKYKQLLSDLGDREQNITKLQTALLIKQRLINNDVKCIKSQQTNIIKQTRQNQKNREQIDEIWSEVLSKTDIDEIFRKNVLAKCKDNLLKQRKIMNEQEAELDKRHEAIEKIINQLHGIQLS